MRDAAKLSTTAPILEASAARMPPVYGPEPPHGWCYFFEKADLARQREDWDEVIALGEAAFALDDHPNDPVERFVFIEGYAHTEDWKKAVELSITSYKVSKQYMAPLLCSLWERIAQTTEDSPRRSNALAEVWAEFECLP
jgi:hypothetical protein